MQGDRLYINDQEVELSGDTVVALTFQINDIATLADRNANYTNQFKVPKTAKNKQIFDNVHLVQSVSAMPYDLVPAKILKNGIEVTPGSGYAVIENSTDVYNITVYSGNLDLYNIIKGDKLSDLDYSTIQYTPGTYSSPKTIWNVATIAAARTNIYTDAWKVPIINYGAPFTARDVDVNNQRPWLFMWWLFTQILTQAGYSYIGDIFTNANFRKVLMSTYNGDEPSPYYDTLSRVKTGEWTDVLPGSPIYPLSGKVYIKAGEKWRIRMRLVYSVPGPSWLAGSASMGVKGNSFGTIPLPVLGWYRNGDNREVIYTNLTGLFSLGESLNSSSGQTGMLYSDDGIANMGVLLTGFGINGGFNPGDTITGAFSGATCKIGSAMGGGGHDFDDVVEFDLDNTAGADTVGEFLFALKFHFLIFHYGHVEGTKYGDASPSFSFLIKPFSRGFGLSETWASGFGLEQLGDPVYGTYLDIKNHVPDMLQTDFVKAVCNLFCLSYRINPISKEIEFVGFNRIKENCTNGSARDWSKLLDIANTPQINYRASTYAQLNWLRYTKDDSPSGVVPYWVYDSNFAIADKVLADEKTVLTVPFAATETGGSFNGMQCPAVTRIDTGQFKTQVVPRIVIDDTQNIAGPVQVNFKDPNTGDSFTTLSNIPLAYFFIPSKPFNLNFEFLQRTFYTALIEALQKYKQVTAFFFIKDLELYMFNHFLPVYIEYFDNYFYVNKIPNYLGSGLTKIELIKL